jgi:hypothetical protein
VLVIEVGDKDPAPHLPRCVPGRHTTFVHVVTVVLSGGDVAKERTSEVGEKNETAGAVEAPEKKKSTRSKKKPPPHRGVAARNAGLRFVRDELRLRAAVEAGGFPISLSGIAPDQNLDPVLFFADDDNEYDPFLFDEISKINRIGVWPVGFPSAMNPVNVESPVVVDGRVTGFFSKFCNNRVYNVDMAGFALRVSVAANATFVSDSKVGHLEDDFLKAALGEVGTDKLEPLGDGCTQVLAWHLGWKFDTRHGKWGLVFRVEQPAPVLCETASGTGKKKKRKKAG